MAKQNSEQETAEQDSPKKKSKLPLIIGVAAIALGMGAGGAWFFMGKGEKEGKDEHAQVKEYEEVHDRGPMKPATFVELEPFTFNLLDEDQDRYAQIGVVLAVVDPAIEGELETARPAVRDALLMLLTSKTSAQLLSIEGKRELGDQIIDSTNAILAGEPAPEIRMPKRTPKKKIKLKMRSDKRSDRDDDRYDDRDAHERDDDDRHSRRRSNRRRPMIRERVYAAHFSKFLIQ